MHFKKCISGFLKCVSAAVIVVTWHEKKPLNDKEKRAVTMADVARLANVSKPTVSRALSNSPLVNEKTREHVLSVAAEHGYAVNRNAQKLRHKRTNTIAVSMDFRSHSENHIADPFMFELLAGVSEALGDHNQDLLLCAPNHNDAAAFRQILNEGGADGFIVLGQGHRENMLRDCAAAGTPLIVWGAAAPDANYCVVGSDNLLGGRLAGEHFIRQGRRHFLFVGDTSFREMHQRRQGLKHAIRESGQEIVLDDVELHGFGYESAFDAAVRYLDVKETIPDAVFTWNDTAAMAFIAAFRNAGANAPDDVSFVGYNDIPEARYFHPPLTTIRQDTWQAGRMLAAKLLRIIDGETPKSATIRTELILRST